eukprot:14893-Pelagococcus_subviridis.AAC.1
MRLHSQVRRRQRVLRDLRAEPRGRVEQTHRRRGDGDEIRRQLARRRRGVLQHRRPQRRLRLQQHRGEQRRKPSQRGLLQRGDQRPGRGLALAKIYRLRLHRDVIAVDAADELAAGRGRARVQQSLEEPQAGENAGRHRLDRRLRAVVQREQRRDRVDCAGRHEELDKVRGHRHDARALRARRRRRGRGRGDLLARRRGFAPDRLHAAVVRRGGRRDDGGGDVLGGVRRARARERPRRQHVLERRRRTPAAPAADADAADAHPLRPPHDARHHRHHRLQRRRRRRDPPARPGRRVLRVRGIAEPPEPRDEVRHQRRREVLREEVLARRRRRRRRRVQRAREADALRRRRGRRREPAAGRGGVERLRERLRERADETGGDRGGERGGRGGGAGGARGPGSGPPGCVFAAPRSRGVAASLGERLHNVAVRVRQRLGLALGDGERDALEPRARGVRRGRKRRVPDVVVGGGGGGGGGGDRRRLILRRRRRRVLPLRVRGPSQRPRRVREPLPELLRALAHRL